MAEPLLRVEEAMTLPADEVIALFRNSSPARFGRLNALKDQRFAGKLAPNRTYSAPTEKPYSAREDYVPVDLSAIETKKRKFEGQEDDEDESPPPIASRSRLADIAERTGLPVKLLEQLEHQHGNLVLRGAELGCLNEKGMFEVLLSAGD